MRKEKLNILGDTSEGVTPVPIPNTEVKSFSAENTCYSFAGKIGHCQDNQRLEKSRRFFIFRYGSALGELAALRTFCGDD